MSANITQENKLKGKRVLIFQQRRWGLSIGHFLAKKLQSEGCTLAALTLKRTTHEFTATQKEVNYALIINNDEIMRRSKDYLRGEDFSLQEICKALNVDSIWPIARTLRSFAMSYKDKYYYSFKQNVSDEEMIDYVKAVYKCIKFVFDKFNPDVILTPNFVSLPHIMFNLFAERHGVRMIEVTDSKVKGTFLFSHGFLADRGPFCDRVDELNDGLVESANRQKARKYIKEFRETFKQPDYLVKLNESEPFFKKIRREMSPYYHTLRWYLKKPVNYLDNLGITPDYRPPKIVLRDHYCRKKYKKFMDNFNYYPFEKMGRFAYFPLQVQPEATIDVIAPYFNNQMEVARQVAMSLPDDYTLVVKEHPAMVGLRPSSYLEKIARTVNVKFVDYRISSETILKRADLVISPSGTTIAEAAFLKKPAIQLGDLGLTLKLPNVIKHTDMKTLSAAIKKALAMNFDNPEYERRLENYVAATYDTGFDSNYLAAWEKGEKEHLDGIWKAYKKEIERVLG